MECNLQQQFILFILNSGGAFIPPPEELMVEYENLAYVLLENENQLIYE